MCWNRRKKQNEKKAEKRAVRHEERIIGMIESFGSIQVKKELKIL